MAGVTMYLQLPFNSSSHLLYLHDLCKSQTCGLGPGGGLVSTPGVFSQFSELEENVFSCKKVVLQGTTPPFIVYLLGRVYQEVKMMTLPENKNQKKIRRGRRKEKTLLTQVMF